MTKDYIAEFRDKIALAILPILLKKCEHYEFYQITDLSYEIADIMLSSRNKQE
jgi:hypothetical protein